MNVRDLFSETPSGLGFSLRREEVSEYFKIDGESRVITPPTDFENFGVESDENSKRVWFEAPRIVDDEIDLSTLNLYVNYQNANGEKDKYIVDDVEVVDDKIYFSWLISRKATRYKGTLTFIVCAIKTNSKGEIQTEWNTTLCTGTVLEGLEVENPEVPEAESDLINQLIDVTKKSIKDVTDTCAQTIEELGTKEQEALNNISEQETNSIDAVEKAKKDAVDYIGNGLDATLTKQGIAAESQAVGDAILKARIVDRASGELISLPDSAEQPLQSMKIYGKTTQDGTPTPENPIELVSVGDSGSTTEYVMGENLFNNDTSLLKEVTYTGSQGGRGTRIGYEPLILPAGTYTFTLTDLDTSLSKYVYGCINDKDDKFVRGCNLLQSTNNYTPLTITVNEGDNIYIYEGQTSLDITERSKTFKAVQIHLNAGSVAKPYEPYKEQSLTISTPNGLPGLVLPDYANKFTYNPSYVADGNKVICNEIDFNGLVRREPVRTFVYTGDEDWKKTNSTKTNCYFVSLPAVSGYGRLSHFKSINSTQYQNGVDGAHTVYSAGLYINASQFATLEEFKTFLKSQYEAGTPLTFVYAVREEKDIIETPLTEEEIQAYKALHTNYPNTTIYNSDGAGAEVEYVADTKRYIDNKIAQLAASSEV